MTREGSGRRPRDPSTTAGPTGLPGLGVDAGSPTAVMAYAVQTRSCSYLLDDTGICRWIVAPTGIVPGHVQQCIGAQFVACLALDTPGGLVPELTIGAHALFVRHVDERLVLLRTGPILSLEDQRASGDELTPLPPPRAAPSVHGAPPPLSDSSPTNVRPRPPQAYGKSGGAPVGQERPTFGRPIIESSGDEQTISVSYRPPKR